MLCQECKKRPATVYYTKIINGERTDIHLCEECAQEKTQIDYNYPFTINDFLAGLFDIPVTSPLKESKVKNNVYRCSVCNLTFDEFKNSGKFGCAGCYNAFSDKLEPILKRLHGNVHHSGKCPKRIGGKIKVKKEIEKLRAQLDKAVKEERYEKAAELRDKIKELENEEIRE